MNNKRKTILTIILLLLCILSIVGASYAYYTISTNSEGGTGSVTATSETVGNVSLSGTGGSMHINLTPADIGNSSGGTFWGTATDAGYVTSEEKLEVANIETTDEPLGVTYTCTFDITVTPTSGNLTNVLGGEILFSNTNVEINGITTNKLAFSSLSEEKVYHASATLKSGEDGKVLISSKIVSSDVDNDETWLSNINGTFSVSSSNLECSAKKGNGNQSPTKPVITRNIDGWLIPGTNIILNAESTDPEGDEITYVWENRDREVMDYPLGTNIVRVKAVDSNGNESDWAETEVFVTDAAITYYGEAIESESTEVFYDALEAIQGSDGAENVEISYVLMYSVSIDDVPDGQENNKLYVEGFNIKTNSWETLLYKENINGADYDGKLEYGIYTKIRYTFIAPNYENFSDIYMNTVSIFSK